MNGFLCVLKPPGMTSSDVVVRVRGKLKRMGIPDCYGQSGTDEELLEYFGLTVENIVHTVEEFIK